MLEDLKSVLLEMDRVEAEFIARKISKMMEKNRYKLFFGLDKQLTRHLGEFVAQIFELVWVYGVMKYNPGGDKTDGK